VINPESIIKLATLDDIAPSCSQVAKNLDKIKNYLKTCSPPSQPDLYFQLIKGVESLHSKLCTESSFKKRKLNISLQKLYSMPQSLEFQEIHQCLHELTNDLEDCAGPADWNENSENSAVCKAYKNIGDCYYIKTAKVCGKRAAGIIKELLQAVIDSILTINCDNVKETPYVKDAMPDDYIKKHNIGVITSSSIVLNTIAAF
ncbi:uncharacterized protein BDFB_011356, partial [Asbolus verrucosus]